MPEYTAIDSQMIVLESIRLVRPRERKRTCLRPPPTQPTRFPLRSRQTEQVEHFRDTRNPILTLLVDKRP